MECLISHSLSDYLDGWSTDQERRDVERHLASCESCAERARDFQQIRKSVRRLPARKLSVHTATQLQVLASRESARRRRRVSLAHAVSDWYERLCLGMQNLMRPLALPVAGGLLSTITLFGLLMPDLAHEVHPVGNDIETSVFTQATVKDISPIGVGDSDITVELVVDENGRMLQYRVVSGGNLLHDEAIRRALQNNLVYGQFNPATQFGQPVTGKVRLTFRSSTIDIRG